MKLSSSCTRWQHLLQTILTEESLSPQEQADLHAHLAECPACARLNEQRLALLSTLRAQAIAAPPEKAWVRSVHSMERMFAQLQPSPKQNAPILSLRSKERQKRRFLPGLKLVGRCILVFLAWWFLLVILTTLLVNHSIHQPLSGTPAEQNVLILKVMNANAASLNGLYIAVCIGAAVSLGLLLGKHFSAQTMRGSRRRSRAGNIMFVLSSEKGQATPQTLSLEALDGKHIRQFARVLTSQTGQLQASFRLIPAGRYILRTSPPTRNFLVSVPQGQTVTIELKTQEEQSPVLLVIDWDTEEKRSSPPHIMEWDEEEEQSPAPQRSSCPDQHPEHWRHLTRDIKV